ncbi:WD40 repeat-like protein [Aspergillus steynii IBT 23096]|uniref:WD40 repeat-like protein n=1 Tax=Aspergillus steynii IBT 23096 TaxID=1392250 RepID=A0A2I2FU59_9EURO|nr:WD40 repeat-like protein [Aspergillus steynii IBT 23096]PLB44154.1 WD40 repeat-like protein [Aspergillus steynii IBT 23096]
MENKSEGQLSWRQRVRQRWKRAKEEIPLSSSHTPVTTHLERGFEPNTGNDTAGALPEPLGLWDEAYDLLKGEKPELLLGYESLLSELAINVNPTAIVPGQDANDLENTIPQHDVTARRQKLEQIAETSFQNLQAGSLKVTLFGKEMALQEAAGKLGNGLNWVQNYSKEALKHVPYAPVAMACTSLLLPLLISPSRVDDENRTGLLYVTSQIRYYIEMEHLLLPAFTDHRIKAQMREHVKGLYKLVIDYQVQSVMKFNRDPVKNYFRSVADYDGWSDQLNAIKEAEKTLRGRFQEAASWLNVKRLNDLEMEAEKSRITLENVTSFTQKIEQHMSEAEYRRCLNTLKATNPQLDKQRIEKLKGGLLKDSYIWVIENQDFKKWMNGRSGQILWIKGQPGKGKTMLVCGIIDELSQVTTPDTNIAFFFCQATEKSLNNASAVLRGLISMIVKQQPSLLSYLSEGCFDGHNAWFALKNTFNSILNDKTLQPTYLLIDGLDECVEDRQHLLELLVEHSSAHQNVKWIVSSRDWLDIERELDTATQMKLHLDLNEDVLSKAIHSFIEYKVEKLANRSVQSKKNPDIWKAVKDHLLSNANGTFLWVALVCEYLAPLNWWNVRAKLEDFPSGLDKVYDRMMSQIINSENAEICKSILGVIATVYRPITLDELMVYVDLPGDAIDALTDLIRLCGSFLSVQDNTVFLIHLSAKEYLTEKASSGILPSGKEIVHDKIFSRSLQTFRGVLRRDIYNLKSPGYSIDEVEPPHPDPLRTVRYACVYWVDHFSCSNIDDIETLTKAERLVCLFLCESYLHWLEAMSILQSIPGAIASIQKLETLANSKPSSLSLRIRDAIRFVQYTKVAIENSPLQVYYSSLIFSPTESIMRQCYHDRERKQGWILKEPLVERSWSPCLQTLEGHSFEIFSIAWSPEGSQLASLSMDGLRIWDPTTGECSLILEDKETSGSSIWWLDDIRLALVSDGTIMVWNLRNKQFMPLFQSHSHNICSMALSPGRSRLAFASKKCIWISDLATSSLESMRQGHTREVSSMSWSPDKSQLASLSDDNTITIWDTHSMECLCILGTSGSNLNYIAWSPDGSRLASGSYNMTIKIWDIKSQDCVLLRGHNDAVEQVAWSPDGSKFASASHDRTILIWDPYTLKCLYTIEGHSGDVISIAWSPDGSHLASGSDDTTIKIWDIGVQPQSFRRGHNDLISSIASSPDRTRVLSESLDETARLWDPTNGQCTTLQGPAGKISRFSGNYNTSKLASIISDNTIRVWDPTTGRLTVCKGHADTVYDIAWSPDESKIASASFDRTVRVWDPNNGHQLSICEGHTDSVYDIAWSPDGSQIASTSTDCTVRVWNPITGRQLIVCEDNTNLISTVAWSHDGSQLGATSMGKISIWNPATGQCIFNVPIATDGFLRFDSSDPDSLHTGLGMFDIRELKPVSTWCSDLNSVPRPRGYGLSEDLSWITYDGTKVLWLPPDHRPDSLDALALTTTGVIIGCVSGVVEFFEFSALNPLTDL